MNATIYEIKIYEKFGDGLFAQARFLVQGFDDVLWTNDIDAALGFLRETLERETRSSITSTNADSEKPEI